MNWWPWIPSDLLLNEGVHSLLELLVLIGLNRMFVMLKMKIQVMLAGPNTKYILALQVAMQSRGTLHDLYTRNKSFGVGCSTTNGIEVNPSHFVSFIGEVQ